jgi:DNA-binding CsgD family transcriptional regulator
MGDMQSIFSISPNCDESIAGAVARFAHYWKGDQTRYSTKSRRYSLSVLVHKIMSDAWCKYLTSIPLPLRKQLQRVNLKENNFEKLATWIRDIENNAYESECSMEDAKWNEFYATLRTMSTLLENCAFKQTVEDKTSSISRSRSHANRSAICTWQDESLKRCGELTEYEAYLKGHHLPGIAISTQQELDHDHCARHRYGIAVISKPEMKVKTPAREKLENAPTWSGKGLCRFCGRLTERDAALDDAVTGMSAAKTNAKRSHSSRDYCVEHRPPPPGKSNSDYRKALRHSEEYFDLRARLQRQSHGDQELKQIHKDPAVNWFENRVVRECDVFSKKDSDPRKAAALEARNTARSLSPELSDFDDSGILKALVSLAGSVKADLGASSLAHEPRSLYLILKNAQSLQPSLFKKTAVLALFAQGTKQAAIAKKPGLSAKFVALTVRHVTPLISPDEDEANISREAQNMISSGITDRKKKIIFLLATGMNQSQVADYLGIKRQSVSKALSTIPEVYRFDKKCG